MHPLALLAVLVTLLGPAQPPADVVATWSTTNRLRVSWSVPADVTVCVHRNAPGYTLIACSEPGEQSLDLFAAGGDAAYAVAPGQTLYLTAYGADASIAPAVKVEVPEQIWRVNLPGVLSGARW